MTMRTIFLEETESTNLYIRQFTDGGEDVAVVARRQTGGRGTKGRTFLSEEGGVYCSILKFYRALPAAEAFRIMAHAAVSVCRTAEKFGIAPKIKWPNDVYAGGRKLCGILIENILEGDRVSASIAGMGVNVTNDVSSLGIAVSMKELLKAPPTAETVARTLIEFYEAESSFADYRARLGFLGDVTVFEGGNAYPARALGVLSDGRLEVQTKEGIRRLGAAEISVRI